MPAEPASSPPESPVRLPAALDLGAAQELLEQIRSMLSAGPLVLEGSAVERISVPCLQVLAAAQREAARGPGLRIVSASPALAAAVADLGLSAAISLEG